MDETKIIQRVGRLSLAKIVPASYVEPGRPRFPKNLSAAGKKKFKKLCRLLAARKTLTEADEEIIMLYCVAADRHARALEHVESEGEIVATSEGMITNPWFAIAEKAERTMLSILDKLGLTPASRDRVKVTRRVSEPDVFEILLNPEKPKEIPCLPTGKTE